jgi:hypothetical protein
VIVWPIVADVMKTRSRRDMIELFISIPLIDCS